MTPSGCRVSPLILQTEASGFSAGIRLVFQRCMNMWCAYVNHLCCCFRMRQNEKLENPNSGFCGPEKFREPPEVKTSSVWILTSLSERPFLKPPTLPE